MLPKNKKTYIFGKERIILTIEDIVIILILQKKKHQIK